MSVNVPTSDTSRDTKPASLQPHPPRWPIVAAVAALLGVVILLTIGDDPPPTPPEEADLGRPESLVPLSQTWEHVVFPGSGAFTDVAASDAGAVAVGFFDQGSRLGALSGPLPAGPSPGEAAVWASVDGQWQEAELERGDAAVVRAVEEMDGRFVIGGALVDDGEAIPAVWVGVPGGRFTLADSGMTSTGWVESVFVVDASLVLVGDRSPRVTDVLAEGARRRASVLTGSPGAWTDITPDDVDAVVTTILDLGDRWMAAGAAGRDATVWLLADGADAWRAHDLPAGLDGVVVDVAPLDDGSLVGVVRRMTGGGSPRTQVVRSSGGAEFHLDGGEEFRDIGWIDPVEGGFVGGPHATTGGIDSIDDFARLWRYDFEAGWSFIDLLPTIARQSGFPSAPRASSGPMVAGVAHGQPAVWRSDGVESSVEVTLVEPEWVTLGALPEDADFVMSAGPGFLALSFGPSATLYRSDGTLTWEPVALPVGFQPVFSADVGDRTVMAGEVDGRIVFIDLADGEPIGAFDAAGSRIAAIGGDDSELVVWTSGPADASRIRFLGGEEVERTQLGRVPEQMWVLDGGVIVGTERGAGFRPEASVVSTDDGSTWTDLAEIVVDVIPVSGETVVITDDGSTFVLDPTPSGAATLTPTAAAGELAAVAAADSPRPFAWAGGLAVVDRGAIWLIRDLGEPPVRVALGPEVGIGGIPFQLLGDGYLVVVDDGSRSLVRWLGEPSP